MKLVLLFLSSAAAKAPRGHELTAKYSYAQYLSDFHKIVSDDSERMVREAVFERALATILAHNADASRSYTRGVNQFTDEPAPKGLAARGSARAHGFESGLPRLSMPHWQKPVSALPARVDWREKGVVSSVKDQGGCGSCWAFATTAAMESHVAIETGVLFALSPQELVSCMPNPDECGGTGGCAGATAELGFEYYIENGGVVQEYQMGYTSYYGSDGACYLKNVTSSSDAGPDPGGIKTGVASITGYTRLPTNDYLALMNAVATLGPVAVSVDAAWADYESGVFEAQSFDSTIDHAVVLVGYGTDDGTDYWLVRNSWSPTWGEHGYIRLRRHDGAEQYCGVDSTPLDGVGCKGGASNTTVCGTSGILSDSSVPTGGYLL